MLAVLYSEDPGSAINGGEIGYKLRENSKNHTLMLHGALRKTVSRIVESATDSI